jgi:hypothetical protein
MKFIFVRYKFRLNYNAPEEFPLRESKLLFVDTGNFSYMEDITSLQIDLWHFNTELIIKINANLAVHYILEQIEDLETYFTSQGWGVTSYGNVFNNKIF